MEKDFAISARRPEKAWLVRNTSRSTSLEMVSTEPGFDRPSASLRSWNDVKTSDRRWTMALDVKYESVSSLFSDESAAIVAKCDQGKGQPEKSGREGVKVRESPPRSTKRTRWSKA